MTKSFDEFEQTNMRKDIPGFASGDTVRVYVRIREGDKERLQAFEGVVIARKHGGLRETFTVRKVSFGIGVERIFPIHSPVIDRIDVIKRGRVRRAKLYYLRNLRGKAARVRERDYFATAAAARAAAEKAAAIAAAEPAPPPNDAA
ncbi:MAG: 50S ribosomal protein L19 [Acidobacteria bacterium]|nr:50S ribosomal protein L19 [Acidobacteriota bacterium]